MKIVAQSLFRYPIKSCAGEPLDRLTFDDDGLIVGDREWVVIDANSEVIWQGSHPKLALVHAQLNAGALRLSTLTGDSLNVPKANERKSTVIKMWNHAKGQHDLVNGDDEGRLASDFLSAVAGASLRLVRLDGKARKQKTDNRVHLVSLASLEALNQLLAQREQDAVALERFRPNVVIAGADDPLDAFIEEHFNQLTWDDSQACAALNALRRCERCVVPNVDPTTAVVTEPPLDAIATLSARRHPGQPAYFGMYGTPVRSSTLARRAFIFAELNF